METHRRSPPCGKPTDFCRVLVIVAMVLRRRQPRYFLAIVSQATGTTRRFSWKKPNTSAPPETITSTFYQPKLSRESPRHAPRIGDGLRNITARQSGERTPKTSH